MGDGKGTGLRVGPPTRRDGVGNYNKGCSRHEFHPQREVSVAARPVGHERQSTSSDAALQRAQVAAQVAEDNRGRDLVILDLREMTTLFDYFVLATGTSRRQLHAMSEEIDRVLEKEMGDKRLGIEGYDESRWILLDYGDVVIHLFDEDTRRYYGIEDLWGQAKRVPYPAQSPKPAGGLKEL